MSLLSDAAEAMGVPEPLAERSARARAEASGQTYEDILTAWAGGQAAATSAPVEAPAEEPAEEAPEIPTEEPEEVPAAAPAAPAAAPAAPAAATVDARPTAPALPPILDAPADRPLVTIAAGMGVVVLVILLGFVFPSLPSETDEIRSSVVELSATGEDGRQAYLAAACSSCHTQSVRAVVADAGVGPVTLADTNQVVGYRRIGPDLSNVGARLSADQIAAVLSGGSHPAVPLSQSSMEALVTYLSESAYMEAGQS